MTAFGAKKVKIVEVNRANSQVLHKTLQNSAVCAKVKKNGVSAPFCLRDGCADGTKAIGGDVQKGSDWRMWDTASR